MLGLDICVMLILREDISLWNLPITDNFLTEKN
jgi:hypothetical protein